MKKNIIIILIITIIFVLCLIVCFFAGSKFISKINLPILGEEETTDYIELYVYDNQDIANVKTLINFYNNAGIEYILKPDGTKIYANGKKNISLDIVSQMDVTEHFYIKPLNINSEVQKDIQITQEMINNQFELTDLSVGSNVNFSVTYNRQTNTDNTYWDISEGNNATWNEYTNTFNVSPEKAYGDGTKTIKLKKQDKSGNIVYANKECEIKMHKITFDINGGSVVSQSVLLPTDSFVGTVYKRYGDTVGNLQLVGKTYYEFKGWYDENDVQYTSNSIMPDNDLVLKAKYVDFVLQIVSVSPRSGNYTEYSFSVEFNAKVSRGSHTYFGNSWSTASTIYTSDAGGTGATTVSWYWNQAANSHYSYICHETYSNGKKYYMSYRIPSTSRGIPNEIRLGTTAWGNDIQTWTNSN